MIYLFIFTLVVTLLNALVYISMFAKHGPFSPPYNRQLDVRSWWIFYPSLFFQIWFWIERTTLF